MSELDNPGGVGRLPGRSDVVRADDGDEFRLVRDNSHAALAQLALANEELLASKADLYTVNAEYQAKLTELAELAGDLDGLLGCRRAATLFLDGQLRLRRFSAAAGQWFALSGADLGRPFGEIGQRLPWVDLAGPAGRVLDGGGEIEQTVSGRDGGRYALRIACSHGDDGRRAGVLVNLVDVDAWLGERDRLRDGLADVIELLHWVDLPEEQLYPALADRLVRLCRYPDSAAVRIAAAGRHWASAGFRDTAWRAEAAIVWFGEAVGRVEMVYLEAGPDGGAFLPEERQLLAAVASCLAIHLALRQARSAGHGLDRVRARLTELEAQAREGRDTIAELRWREEALRLQNVELSRIEIDLLAARRRYQDLFNYAPVAYMVVDPVGAIQEANQSAVELLGMERRSLVRHMLPPHAADAGQRQNLLRYLARLARGEATGAVEIALRRRGGELRMVEIRGRRDDAGQSLRLSLVDLSDRAALEEQRRLADEQQRLAASVFEESNEAIMITDEQARIVRVNRAFTLVTGYSEAEALGNTPAMLSSGRQDNSFYQRMWQNLQEHDRWQGEIWNRRKNGETYAEWLSIASLRGGQGQVQYYIASFSDITEKKQSQLRIEHFAHFDSLTELPNRVLFHDRLKNALVRAHRNDHCVALLFLDLDGFKSVNDSLGHQTGDQLLQQVAGRLRRTVRGTDTVSRLGGDEFTIILTDIESRDQAVEVAGSTAAKIIDALAQPFLVDDQEIHSGASIGIAVYPVDGETVSDLVKHADTAMYHAKASGRGTLAYFLPDMRQAAMRRLTLDNRLRRAVERGDFKVAYQPIVDSRGGRLVGLESLLRWHDDELGAVAPNEFVKALEDLGLIDPVTDWLLDTVCRQIKHWDAAGLNGFRVSFNLSPRSFRRPDCAQAVGSPLSTHGIGAGKIAVEITETHMMQSPTQAVAILDALREAGFHVGMDDFGTGYSSLSLLKRSPVDFIKIDGAFVRDLLGDPNDAALVRAIIAMGDSLGLNLVAEGVESEAQVAALQGMGCHIMQGYHYARPMAAEAFPDWHRQWLGGSLH